MDISIPHTILFTSPPPPPHTNTACSSFSSPFSSIFSTFIYFFQFYIYILCTNTIILCSYFLFLLFAFHTLSFIFRSPPFISFMLSPLSPHTGIAPSALTLCALRFMLRLPAHVRTLLHMPLLDASGLVLLAPAGSRKKLYHTSF